MKLAKIFVLLVTTLLALQMLIGDSFCLALRKVEHETIESTTADLERHKVHKAHHKETPKNEEAHANKTANTTKATAPALVEAKTKVQTQTKDILPTQQFNATNNTLSNSLYYDLNQTFVNKDLPTFKAKNRKWIDNKLYDKQIEEIYNDLIYQQDKQLTPAGVRAAIQIFTRQYEACDTNSDNVLSLEEFTGCMANDTYLNEITPTVNRFATYANYSFTNSTGFYPILYNVIDNFHLNYTNFHDYMLLRLMVFSWRKCSVLGPFIEEVAFECAIEIAGGWKTLSRTTSRHLYQIALELSNGRNVRNIDFITYVIVAQSARLFGKINGKEDQDATKSEFNLALDSGLIPTRYNQDVINQLFRLVEEREKPNQGIDIISFVYYDFILRLFDQPTFIRRWYMNLAEFTGVFNNYLFPWGTLQEIQSIPQNNLTAQSYQMYTYLNISQYHQEADFFLKFAQKNEKVRNQLEAANLQNGYVLEGNGNMTFNLNITAQWIFSVIDNNADGWINFYDFGSFLQIAYLYNKFDKNSKGRVVCGTLFEKYNEYADFPFVSYHIRERAQRFNLLPQDLYLDLLRAILVLRFDDIISATVRRVDPSSLYEVELKNIFSNVNLAFVPDAYLNKCLRGVDDYNVPKYDWECAFLQALTTTAQYLESSQYYLITKQKNLTLANTVFVNVDPAIK